MIAVSNTTPLRYLIAIGHENLSFSGRLGVLERADTMGLVADFPKVLEQLKAGGFFFAESLHQQLLHRHRLRTAAK